MLQMTGALKSVILATIALCQGSNANKIFRNLIIMELNSEALLDVLNMPTFVLEMNEDNE